MEFEYDPEKSLSNKDKHGIDFEEAQGLWRDDDGIILETGFLSEERFLRIGRIAGRTWTAVYAHRDDRLRIISVRRARSNEVEIYEDNLGRRV